MRSKWKATHEIIVTTPGVSKRQHYRVMFVSIPKAWADGEGWTLDDWQSGRETPSWIYYDGEWLSRDVDFGPGDKMTVVKLVVR